MAVGDRFVRRHNAARTATANTTAADISYDTAVISETGYSWSTPEVTVTDAGLYLTIFDIGQVQVASTRAVGTLVPSVNTTDQVRFRATHRYLRNSGGTMGASIGMAILDLSASDDVKVRNPGALAPTDAVGNYATNASYGGGFQLIRLPDGNFTHVERTVDAAEVGTSNINTTRPWLDSSGTWTTITYNSEVQDDDSLYPGSGGDVTLAADTKYAIVWGANIQSTDSSRHTDVVRLQIDGNNVQSGSGYQRTTASQGPPVCGLYFHETGVSSEVCRLQATHETEGGDAGTPNVADAYLQVVELPSGAEWIHVDNSTTDSLTTALAGTTTWYDTPLSSTFRADGDSNLSLDSGNDAVQNDSGGSLPVLAVGWHRWDRDSGASGTRKQPWTRWDNGGAAVGYGVAGAYSRGQQSGDDTFQAHYCSAVTLDLADGADLSFQVNEPQSAANSDMGVYASTSRYFLGVQVLNLETLTAGGEDTLLADDVESASELTSPVVGQEHDLLADDVESASEITAPTVGQEHGLLADDVQSTTELTAPVLSESNILLADDVESSTELTSPSIGQEHDLTVTSVESASELTSPSVGQEHGLLADDIESASELTNPTLSESHILLADDVESSSEITGPAIGQEHTILADDIESATEVSSPVLSQLYVLSATSVESASEVSGPVLAEVHVLIANSLESASEITVPGLGQEHGLLADDVESASELTDPELLSADHQLLADDVESQAEISIPTLYPHGGGSVKRQWRNTYANTWQ